MKNLLLIPDLQRLSNFIAIYFDTKGAFIGQAPSQLEAYLFLDSKLTESSYRFKSPLDCIIDGQNTDNKNITNIKQ